jgi:hypothetical protein
MPANSKLVRAAHHEASHSTLAVLHHLPVLDCTAYPDGRGLTRYSRPFTVAEAAIWVAVTLAGAEGEMLLCDCDSRTDRRRHRTIREMTRRLGIRFLDLESSRARARKLVLEYRRPIGMIATSLLVRRCMTGDDISELLSGVVAALASWVR